MQEEAMKFEELLKNFTVVDKHDKTKPLGTAIQHEYENLVEKINEYGRGGDLTIKIKLAPVKDTKNEVSAKIEITSKPPKRSANNRVYIDPRANGLFLDNPDQEKLFSVKELNSDNGKKKMMNSK